VLAPKEAVPRSRAAERAAKGDRMGKKLPPQKRYWSCLVPESGRPDWTVRATVFIVAYFIFLVQKFF
jgi:hypothetical protein